MRKKAVCLLLCVLLALPVALSGCKEDTTIAIEDYSDAVTLTLYGIKGEGTTEEAVQRVEDAMNVVSEYEFKVHLDLRLYPEDEYASILEEKMAKLDAKASAGDLESAEDRAEDEAEAAENGKETEETEEKVQEGYIDDNGDYHYPEVGEDQLDIFLVTDLDSFNRYYTDYNIYYQLDSELDGNSYLIKKQVNPTLLNAYKIDDRTFAVANNHIVGNYQFLLLNKGIMDDLYYSKDDITTISQLRDYISEVIDYANLGMTGTKKVLNSEGRTEQVTFNYSDYTAVYDTFGVAPLATYLIDDMPSAFGAYIGREPAADANAMPRNLLSFLRYKNEYVDLSQLKQSGYIQTVNPEDIDLNEAKAAAVLVEGTSELASLYSDEYYVSVYKYPMATNTEVFSSAYAVCTYSENVSACMDIISYLSTDREFRNIFQYGVEGTDFEFDEDNDALVHLLTNDYNMNPLYTGNQFIMYQNDRMTQDELYLSNSYWQRGKSQNNNMIADPYLGFSAKTTPQAIELFYLEEDAAGKPDMPFTVDELYEELVKLSDDALAKLANPAANYAKYKVDSISGLVDAIGAELAENKYVKAVTANTYKNSPFTLYVAWHKQMHPTEASAITG